MQCGRQVLEYGSSGSLSPHKNSLDAEDVTQEVFVALLKTPTITDENHLKSWLIRVAINKSRNLRRFFARRKSVPLEAAASKHYFAEEDSGVLDIVNKRPAIERDIVFLHYFEGYTAKEIGEILNKNENAIFARLKRIKVKLKDILEDENEKVQRDV